MTPAANSNSKHHDLKAAYPLRTAEKNTRHFDRFVTVYTVNQKKPVETRFQQLCHMCTDFNKLQTGRMCVVAVL